MFWTLLIADLAHSVNDDNECGSFDPFVDQIACTAVSSLSYQLIRFNVVSLISSYSNAKDCKATRHCIQTVWEKRPVPVDTDSICQICKDMVNQARDQLRSNETEEELKEVFEGSCKLIPVKLVQKECIALADNFVPELVEALSSEMNPDVGILYYDNRK